MASRRVVTRAALAAVAVVCLSSSAMADPSAADKETARGLMNQGRAARDKGDLKAAIKAFGAADALMHVPTTGIELAKAQAAAGLLVEARDTALRVTRIAEKPGDPAPFKAARDAASSLNDELGGRIPSLTVDVKNVPDGKTPEVTIDGANVPAEALGSPRKLDPGHHVVEAKAGTASGKEEVDLAEKDTKSVTVELPAQSAAPADATATTGDTPPTDATPSETHHGTPWLMWGGFGLAGAGVIAGGVTGFLAMSKANSVKGSSSCQNGGSICNPSEDGDISSAKSMATISTISFVVAGVGAAAGLIGMFVGGGSDAPASDTKPADAPSDAPAAEPAALRVVPWIGLASAGVNGTF